MNCEECKQSLLTSPQEMPEPAVNHIQDCPECHAYYGEIGDFELTMQDAVQIGIPSDLSDKIHNKKFYARRVLGFPVALSAMAATTFIVVGFFAYLVIISPPAIDRVVLAHIEKEPFTLTNTQPQDMKAMEMMLASLNIKMTEPLKVRFVKRCFINDKMVAHLVIDGKQGPVTVLLMPNEVVREPKFFSDIQVDGLIVPVNQRASIAVVGFKGERINDVSKSVQSHFDFVL